MKIEKYGKARSACIVLEILWIKLKYNLALNFSNLLHMSSKAGFCRTSNGCKENKQDKERKEKPNVFI